MAGHCEPEEGCKSRRKKPPPHRGGAAIGQGDEGSLDSDLFQSECTDESQETGKEQEQRRRLRSANGKACLIRWGAREVEARVRAWNRLGRRQRTLEHLSASAQTVSQPSVHGSARRVVGSRTRSLQKRRNRMCATSSGEGSEQPCGSRVGYENWPVSVGDSAPRIRSENKESKPRSAGVLCVGKMGGTEVL